FQGHAFVDTDVVLDLDVVADAHVVGHEDVLPERAVCADDGLGHDVAEVPHLAAGAEVRAVVDVGTLVDVGVGVDHDATGTAAPIMGSVTGSPFMTRERCAACSTPSTWRPLVPSVRGGVRVLMASRNAWHS